MIKNVKVMVKKSHGNQVKFMYWMHVPKRLSTEIRSENLNVLEQLNIKIEQHNNVYGLIA